MYVPALRLLLFLAHLSARVNCYRFVPGHDPRPPKPVCLTHETDAFTEEQRGHLWMAQWAWTTAGVQTATTGYDSFQDEDAPCLHVHVRGLTEQEKRDVKGDWPPFAAGSRLEAVWLTSPTPAWYTTKCVIRINTDVFDVTKGADPDAVQAITAHELGHCLGFMHSDDPTSAMGMSLGINAHTGKALPVEWGHSVYGYIGVDERQGMRRKQLSHTSTIQTDEQGQGSKNGAQPPE